MASLDKRAYSATPKLRFCTCGMFGKRTTSITERFGLLPQTHAEGVWTVHDVYLLLWRTLSVLYCSGGLLQYYSFETRHAASPASVPHDTSRVENTGTSAAEICEFKAGRKTDLSLESLYPLGILRSAQLRPRVRSDLYLYANSSACHS